MKDNLNKIHRKDTFSGTWDLNIKRNGFG